MLKKYFQVESLFSPLTLDRYKILITLFPYLFLRRCKVHAFDRTALNFFQGSQVPIWQKLEKKTRTLACDVKSVIVQCFFRVYAISISVKIIKVGTTRFCYQFVRNDRSCQDIYLKPGKTKFSGQMNLKFSVISELTLTSLKNKK